MAELMDQNKKQQDAQVKTVTQRKGGAVLQDNRSQVRKAHALSDNRTTQLEQNPSPKPNNTGLPDNLKTGIESLSGLSMDQVRVHYNSDKPAQLNAHAYAQGSDIHVASGQEKHLPHEAWHVVQQAQGRVKPTIQLRENVQVNDDVRLEAEADLMGSKALDTMQMHKDENIEKFELTPSLHPTALAQRVTQRVEDDYTPEQLVAKLAGKQAQGMPGVTIGTPLKYERYRKLNRLGGELDKRKATPDIPAVLTPLKTVLEGVQADPAIAKDAALPVGPTNAASLAAITTASDLTSGDIEAKRDGYETYSMLGPLSYWLDNKVVSAPIETALRGLRQKMAERDDISIVAHRGHGPTNRTRGGLIGQGDPRRVANPAENSTSAFDAAYAATTKNRFMPALDGVECDVFLSSDNRPILSHEGAVKEQLSTQQQIAHAALVADDTHIEDLSAAQLKLIQRTALPTSNFLELNEFLVATIPTATAYYGVTGKPFRIEIEMKGSPSQRAIDAAVPAGTPNGKALKANFTKNYSARLTKAVATTLSKFKKANPLAHWNFVLFNGSAEDALAFDALRKLKTQLGGIYTGWGGTDRAKGAINKVDELRMAASDTNLLAMQPHDDFIVTYVPGAERPYDTPNAALGPLTFAPTQSPNYVNAVQTDMADQTGAQADMVNRILKGSVAKKKIHLLTDYPSNAAKYKIETARNANPAKYQALSAQHNWRELLQRHMITQVDADAMRLAVAQRNKAKKLAKIKARKDAKAAKKK